MSTALSFVLHLLGAVLWTGGLLALSRVLMAMARQPAAMRPGLSYIAGRLNILAVLGAVLSLPSGLYQLSQWQDGSFRQAGWLHTKLTLIIVLMVVHVLCWRRLIKWRSAGEQQSLPRGGAAALHGLVGLVLIGVLLAVYLGKPHFLRISAYWNAP